MPKRRRRGGRALLLLALLVVGLTAGAVYAAYRTVTGVQELQAARTDLRAARASSGDPDALRSAIERAGSHTRRARAAFDDPAVRLASTAPVLGRPIDSAQGLARASDTAVRKAVGPLARAAGRDVAARLLPGGGRLDLAYLSSLASPSAKAARGLDAADRELATAPVSSGLGLVDEARREFADELESLRSAVHAIALTAQVGPRMLGADGVRRYLLLAQSPAEARGTGGLLGGYQLVEADAGRLRVVRSGTKADLVGPADAHEVVDLGAAFSEHYGSDGPTRGWINFNLSPSAANAGRTAQALWREQTGQTVDGVALVDPGAFSYLLQATGPVTDLGGQPVTAQNVGSRMMKDVYARYPDDQPQQDRYLQQIAETLADKVLSGQTAGQPLVEALTRSSRERRLQLWTADPAATAALRDQPLSGLLPSGRGTGVVVIDSAGSKLDFYLDRDVTYTPGCGSGPSRLDVVLRNLAPARGLPAFVTPAQFRKGLPPGTNKLIVTLYTPTGSTPGRLVRDGDEQTYRTGDEDGLRWVEAFSVLRPGAEQRFSLEFTDQESSPVRLVQQPLVRELSSHLGSC